MKLDTTNPTSDEDLVVATSLRLNKAVWKRLQEESENTKTSSKTKFISCQKMVELILKQVLDDDKFELKVPPELVKPQEGKKGKK